MPHFDADAKKVTSLELASSAFEYFELHILLATGHTNEGHVYVIYLCRFSLNFAAIMCPFSVRYNIAKQMWKKINNFEYKFAAILCLLRFVRISSINSITVLTIPKKKFGVTVNEICGKILTILRLMGQISQKTLKF